MSREYRFEIQGQWFRFDAHSVDVELEGSDARVHLTPTERDILAYHMSHSGKFVPDQDLLDSIWHGKNVYPDLPGKHTRSLRQKLADAVGLNPERREQLLERSGKLGYRFQPDSLEMADNREERASLVAERSALDMHRAELVVFAPHINSFLSTLGEFREISEILAADPSSKGAASMLMQVVENFKYSGDEAYDLEVEMQKYLGHYMNAFTLLLDGLHMLANERVFGFNTDAAARPFTGHRTFDSNADFEDYLSAEVGVGVDLLTSAISFMKETFHERPDILLLQERYREQMDSMIQWSRKIAKDSRGNEMLFERI